MRNVGRANPRLSACVLLSGIVAVAGGVKLMVSQPVPAVAAPHLEIIAQDPGPFAGRGVEVTVAAVACGNPVSGFRDTIGFSSSDRSAWLPYPYSFTAADAGSHVFWVAFGAAGDHALRVADVTNPGVGGATAVFEAVPLPTAMRRA